jgi:CRP-like cAMP-binding protein
MFKQDIFKTGDIGHTSYKILKGEVECVAINPLSNEKMRFNRHGVGEFIAQICLINPTYKHFYDCVAVERTTLEAYEVEEEHLDFVERSITNPSAKKWNTPLLLFNMPFYINTLVYEKDEYIYKENENSSTFYVMIEGDVQRTRNGKKLSRSLRYMEIFGAIDIILGQAKQHTCRSTTKTKVVSFTVVDTESFRSSPLGIFFYKKFKTQLSQTNGYEKIEQYKKNIFGSTREYDIIKETRKNDTANVEKQLSVNINNGASASKNAATSLSPKWALVKETFVNNAKLKSLRTLTGNRTGLRKSLIEQQESLLLNMISVNHKPVEVHVEPIQMGARRNSTSKIMMIDEQRHFHKKGIEATTSIVDTRAPKAMRYSVYKSISRVLDNKFRVPGVALPKAIKNHMNRAELQQYQIDEKHYKRHITKAKTSINTNNRRNVNNNFKHLMQSLTMNASADSNTSIHKKKKNKEFSKYVYNRKTRPSTAGNNRRRTFSFQDRTNESNRTRNNKYRPRTALPRRYEKNSIFQKSASEFNIFLKKGDTSNDNNRREAPENKYRAFSI